MCVVGLCCVPVVADGQGASGDSSGHLTSISTSEAAIATCNRILDIQDLTSSKTLAQGITASPQVFVDTTTPFVHSLLNGRRSWLVNYGEVKIQMDSLLKGQDDTCTKLMTASIDSATGQLIQLNLYNVPDSVVGFDMPSIKVAEKQIKACGDCYFGLPEVLPEVSMPQALRMCGEYFAIAKQTTVQYLVVSKLIAPDVVDTFPAWVVYMRGTQLLGPTLPAPAAASRHARLIVNALTGRNFGIVNLPIPVPDDYRR